MCHACVAAIETGIARSAEEHKRSNSSLQIGLLDPIALTVRSMTTSVLPTVHKATESVYTEPREYWQAWIVGLIFIGFLVANWWIPRFFCRVVCPLGALLGIFSRFALWRIDRDPGSLHGLRLVLEELRGSVRPSRRPAQERVLRLSQLHRRLPARRPVVSVSCLARPARSPIRRSAAASSSSRGSLGLFFFPMARLSGGVRKNFQRGCDPTTRFGCRG